MQSDPSLLVVWHSRTGAAEQMAQAAAHGARQAMRELQDTRLALHLCRARNVDAALLAAASGYLFCAPENLGTVSGEMKEFFDRHYYAVLDRIAGRPYGLLIAAGTDGTGAQRQMARIATGWRLRAIAPAVIGRIGAQTPEAILAPKKIAPDVRAQCEEMGGTLAATLLL
jgi:multimeric flavodoxin WrbA